MNAQKQIKTEVQLEPVFIASLTIRRWQARVSDKRISEAVKEKYGTDVDFVGNLKRLIAKEANAEFNTIANKIRTTFYKLTTRWSGDSSVLPPAYYFELIQAVKEAQLANGKALKKYKKVYPDLKREAELALGPLYDPTEYPTLEQLDSKFAIELQLETMHNPDQFEVLKHSKLFKPNDIEQMKCDFMSQFDKGIEANLSDCYERAYKLVKHLSERVELYDPAKPSKNPFRDSTIENLQKLIETLANLNFTKNQAVIDLAQEIETKLASHSPEVLRTSETARQQIKDDADNIVKRLQNYLE